MLKENSDETRGLAFRSAPGDGYPLPRPPLRRSELWCRRLQPRPPLGLSGAFRTEGDPLETFLIFQGLRRAGFWRVAGGAGGRNYGEGEISKKNVSQVTPSIAQRDPSGDLVDHDRAMAGRGRAATLPAWMTGQPQGAHPASRSPWQPPSSLSQSTSTTLQNILSLLRRKCIPSGSGASPSNRISAGSALWNAFVRRFSRRWRRRRRPPLSPSTAPSPFRHLWPVTMVCTR